MLDTPFTSTLDRRKFLNGRWTTQAPESPSETVEIASVLVQVRPERLGSVTQGIEELPGVQVYSHDPRGKLVVVLEALSIGAIGTILNHISFMPDVLSAALVFHSTDEA